ncbi:MAG: 30S ribosomal protein S12 methylthiotransferase RimO [Clostridia bacterium]|nr:30S ribosomal protein S12 methylthiotransferase RimO [Clostridia bacterium]
MANTVGLISLGCPKNQVDAEHMLAALDEAGFEIVDYVDGCDVVIVNTCGFIDDAKKEAIENILDMVELKNEGVIGSIIVSGCLAQRYKEEILSEIPEVDAVIGIGANGDIVNIVKNTIEGNGEMRFPPQCELPLDAQRILTTPSYWAYLKIAEGCSNCCTYCTIPSIRGKMRSREMEPIIEEARQLAEIGVKELVVIAQDTTAYGIDIYGEYKLPELLSELCKIDGIEWIRILYCYPDKITDELIDTMAKEKKILNYIDLPLQHCNNGILKAMNRKGTKEEIVEVVNKLRAKMPDVVIRTTFITGFPGEGEDEFEELAVFVNEMEFDRVGCFAFSVQEGTPAYNMENQVEEDVKVRRGEIIMDDQYLIMSEKNNEKIGNIYDVLVEGYDPYTDTYFGRTYMDAPDIDSQVHFTGDDDYEEGEFVEVEILGVNEYDLVGKAVQ